MSYKLLNYVQGKISAINCLCDNLLEDIDRLKKLKEDALADRQPSDNMYRDAIGLVSYMEAMDEMVKAIELTREGYIDVLVENYQSDIRELESEILEADDIYEDGLDYTCYPADFNYQEDETVESIPF